MNRRGKSKALLLWSCVCLAAGCGTAEKKPDEPQDLVKDEKKAGAGSSLSDIRMPGEESDEAGSAAIQVLINEEAAAKRSLETGYVKDDQIDAGALTGIVKFDVVLGRDAAAQSPIDVKAGTWAIRNAVKGEIEYYENLKLKEHSYVSYDYGRRWCYPTWAVLVVRGVKVGRQEMLSRPVFTIREGTLQAHVMFTPVGERILFGTYDSYPSTLVVSALEGGAAFWKGVVAAYDREKNIKPLGGGGVHYLTGPELQQTDVIETLCGYEIRDERHPWKRAYAFAVDSPCVAVPARECTFTISGLPVGTHTLEVWHPVFEPAEKTMAFEIRKNSNTELAVVFKAPDWLKATAAPDK